MLTFFILLVGIGVYSAHTKEKNTEAITAALVAIITAPVLFGRFLYKSFVEK